MDNFYSLFSYPKYLVDKGVELLSNKDKKFLERFIRLSKNPSKVKGYKKIVDRINFLIKYKVLKINLSEFCPREEIEEYISNLSMSKKEILFKRYTLNENYELQENLESLKEKKYLSNMSREIKEKFFGVEVNSDKFAYKSLREYFPNVSDELLFQAVNNLVYPYRELIYKKYGENLDNKKRTDLSLQENTLINTVILRIIKRNIDYIKNNGELVYVTDIFKGIDKERLKKAFKEAGYEEYLNRNFGSDLKSARIIKNGGRTNVVDANIKAKIYKQLNIHKVFLISPFYNKFINLMLPNESYDSYVKRVNQVVKSLKEEDYKNLIKVYGENLDKVIVNRGVNLRPSINVCRKVYAILAYRKKLLLNNIESEINIIEKENDGVLRLKKTF